MYTREQLSAPSARTQKRASVAVRAAEGDAADEFANIKPTKIKDFKDMSNDAILEEVTKCKKMLFQLRMRQSTRKEFKPHHFGIIKTKVAQLYTVKREREMGENVNKRDSRALKFKERAANIYL
jgi:large subunit ribosomal protein L29